MANALDKRYAQSAQAHIQAARSAPHRKDLELNQAQNFARLIQDLSLRQEVESEIHIAEGLIMADASDKRYAQSAQAHIQAARSAPLRKDLELNQAQNFARLIQDLSLRQEVESEIRTARYR